MYLYKQKQRVTEQTYYVLISINRYIKASAYYNHLPVSRNNVSLMLSSLQVPTTLWARFVSRLMLVAAIGGLKAKGLRQGLQGLSRIFYALNQLCGQLLCELGTSHFAALN